MTTFTVTSETSTVGFSTHLMLDPVVPIAEQLGQRKLIHGQSMAATRYEIESTVLRNSLLRVDFGWSFETINMLHDVINSSIADVSPKYTMVENNIISDSRFSWIGFMPANIFERAAYDNLSIYELSILNNEIVDFQEDILSYIVNSKLYKQHCIIRNDRFKFNYLKSVRKDPDALEEAYWHYISAIKETVQITQIPRDIIEEDIGCHFLHNPELFFRLMTITILKGDIYE